jgi:hypothetical protein
MNLISLFYRRLRGDLIYTFKSYVLLNYNGIFNKGGWTYSMQACEDEYITKLPDIQSQIEEASLSNDVRSVINMYLRALIA